MEDIMTIATTARVHHRYVEVQGHQVFYREAGSPDAPAIVLLHGFPSSSHMYRTLIPLLADRYHVIAPDYLGSGYSDAPAEFTYGFESMTSVITEFLETAGVTRFAMYIQDFGAPIGLRIAARHPGRVTAIVTQNGNAYVEGISEKLMSILVGDLPTNDQLRGELSLPATKAGYLDGVPDPTLVSPDAWVHDQAVLDRPGIDLIQFAMLRDYRSNLTVYPEIHEYFRTTQVPLLAVWGDGDRYFVPAGALAYKKDLPNAEVHLVRSGHFALETHADTIAGHMREFLARVYA
jgi:pimeloyl-ACP methyl ester carboxylesterase